MSKNIPITARVNKGLFNNKNGKVTEPLLSVGPAGVSGNNQTRPIPAPAKMTSPLKKSEGPGDKIIGKNEPKNAVTIKTTKKGTDTVVKGKDKVIPGKKYVPNENAWWRSRTPEQKAAHNKKVRAEIAKNPDYQDKIVKGADEIVKGKDTEEKVNLMTMNEGDAMNSWERRSNDRAVFHTARKTKRAEIDLAKAKADNAGLTGKDRRDYIAGAKKEAKLKQAEAKVAGLTGSRDAAILQNQQSKKAGGTIKGTQLDYSKEQTMSASQATAGNEADIKANYNYTVGKTFDSTSTPEGGANPATTKDTTKDAGKLGTTTPPAEVKKEEPTPAAKKVIGFFSKKSPLKMKYFK